MTEIQSKLQIVSELSSNLTKLIQQAEIARAKARREIDGDGLTSETCLALSQLMFQAEKTALRVRDGLKSVHQLMEPLVPDGVNEGGNKDWP